MTATPNILDQYEAAVLLGMSPELLRFLTIYQAKWKDGRKLQVKKEVGGVLYFDKSELNDYSNWLKAPWPSKEGTRPGIPEGIRNEIRVEANLECALCGKSGQSGEAAHIDPIKTSKNNHPHNLIWLCSNHHTNFDNGCLGPKGASNEVVTALKIGLQHFKRSSWQGQAEISRQIASTLSLCSLMQKRLQTANTAVEVAAVESIAKQALQLLPQLASQSAAQVVKPTLGRMTAELAEIEADETSSIKTRTRRSLRKAASFETAVLTESGLIQCPLCKGAKTHNGYDCPVCAGEGAVSKDLRVELDEFELIDCQLCSGTGKNDEGDCLACGGDGRLERRIADSTDFSIYKLVRCPLCKGKGRRNGVDCPECGGDREIPGWAADRIDLENYDEIDCPRCEGAGVYEGDYCPECNGERTMERQYADRVDLSKYESVDCPLCNGDSSFTYMDGDCPVCSDGRKILKGEVERIDLHQYELVKCPACRGTGRSDEGDCHKCQGHRKLPRMYAERD